MKGPGDMHGKAAKPRGSREEPRRSTQPDGVERATLPPRPSVDEMSAPNPVRVAPATSPQDALRVSLSLPPYEQGALPSVSPDERQVYIPGADEEVAGIPPANAFDEKIEAYQVRLAPATSPPDASTVSLSLQQGALPSTIPANQQEVYIPGADEEVPDTPTVDDPTDNSSVGIDQGVSTPDPPAPDETSVTQDEVFSAYLVLSPEERRRQLMEQAVTATNVHVVEPRRTRRREWSRRTKVAVALCVVVAAIVAISLGVTLGGRRDPTRFDQVASLVEFLFNTTLEDSSTPQYQAAKWMADEDAMFENLATVAPDRFSQRYVLALFYFATGGPTSWLETSFFLKPDAHECEWVDTQLPDTQSWSGYVGVYDCSSGDWVERIEINQNNLTGTLPTELGSLSSLEELTVMQNIIGGTLPTSLLNNSNLQVFDVWSNELTGTIPTEVGRATSLRILSLLANSLSGTIPIEIDNLSSLEELGVNRNFLTGSIPTSLLQLPNITRLEFAHNALTGTLPPSVWSSWPNLLSFGIGFNLLSGTIPNNLDSVPRVEKLVLQQNNFTGPFPSSIVKLTNVTWFLVDRNDLTGSLPNDWTNLSSTLDWLMVSRNRLTGTVPEALGSLTELEVLNLFENGFNGTIPSSLERLTKLQTLQMGNNRLTGTVPLKFARLSSLQLLSFHRSELTGDLSFLCNGTEMLFPFMTHFHADCLGETPEVVCPCCNLCCNIHDTCLYV